MSYPKGKPRENLIGKRFGRLVVTDQTGGRQNGSIIWGCMCDCGTRRLVPTNRLRSGNTQSCGCLQKERQRSAVAFSGGESAFRRLYRGYKRNARNKNRAFSISKEEFRKLTKLPCYYCGAEPTNTLTEASLNGSYTYNGLDRVDTNAGYTPDNVVPCCKHCNVAKRAMTQEEFAEWSRRLYNHWAKDFT